MFFNEEIIQSVEENPVLGIVNACELITDEIHNMLGSEGWNEDTHELLWEATSFLKLAIETNHLNIDTDLPDATGNIEVNCQNLWAYINEINKLFKEQSIKLKVESYKSRYQTAFKSSFAYEFSEGDLNRVQTLVNELRDHISGNDLLEADHKQRLLNRLETLQSEIHKRVSDLDKFWGMVGDAGVVLGKLGTDAKPIVDRIKEIAEIVWKTQARTEELPSDSHNPMLEHEESSCD